MTLEGFLSYIVGLPEDCIEERTEEYVKFHIPEAVERPVYPSCRSPASEFERWNIRRIRVAGKLFQKDIEDTYDEEIHPTPRDDTEDEVDDGEARGTPASGYERDAPETASESEATESESHDWEDDDEEDPEEDSFEEEDHQDLFEVSVPEGLSPQEAEDEAKKWVVGVLERTLGDMEVKIDAGHKTESVRWGVRFSSHHLHLEYIVKNPETGNYEFADPMLP